MAARQTVSWRRVAADPALLTAILAVWILLLLFVLYPLAHLLERAFFDESGFTLEPLLASLVDSSHQTAFANSLILATVVGVLGTALGFLFALTAVRAGLSRHWLTFLDAAALLPLVSPPFTTSIAIIFSFGPKGFITHDLLGLTNVSRPDLIAGVPLYLENSALPGGKRFNPAAFDGTTPLAQGRQGTLGRGTLRGFGLTQADLSIRRHFRLFEGLGLDFRADAFNIFNTPNFANPTGVMTSANFGRSTQILSSGLGGLNPLFQVGGPRSIQLALKLQF